jgi:hypothetical protein
VGKLIDLIAQTLCTGILLSRKNGDRYKPLMDKKDSKNKRRNSSSLLRHKNPLRKRTKRPN